MRKRNTFWGILFIVMAFIIVISKLGIMPDVGIFSILMTVFWVWVFVDGIRHMNFYEILFPVAFLCIIYDKPLGIEELTPWTVLTAALLGSIGLSMLFRRKKNRIGISVNWHNGQSQSYNSQSNDEQSADNGGHSREGHAMDSTYGATFSTQCNDDHVCCENNLGSVIRYINSDNFCDAHLENNFGSMTLYFDNAIIQQETARIEVENSFGQIALYIPKEWQIRTDVDTSFGCLKEYGTYKGNSNTLLYILGESNFGNIELHYV